MDTAGLLDDGNRAKNGAGVSPRDLFNTLRNLADYAAREEINMTVFLTGRPLREAPDGASFKGVKVRYAESTEHISKLIVDTIPSLLAKHEVIVVTANPSLDQAAGKAGALCIRSATFRKAREDKSDQREQRNGAPQHGQGQQRRRHQGQQQNNQQQQTPQAPSARPEKEQPNDERESRQDQDVQSLIDPL